MFYYKNKNDKKKRILAGAVAVIIVLAMIASMVVSAFAEETQGQVQAKSYDLTFNKKTTGVFGRGVSYEGISLEGKTYDEAVSEINEYANDRLTRYMQWDVLGYKYDYDGSSFSTTWTNPDVVSQLSNMTLEGNLVEQYKKQKDIDQSPIDLDLQFTVDEDAVRSTVAEYTSHFYKDPQNATVTRENGQFVVTDGVTGVSFDTDAIAAELLAKIEDFSTADSIQYSFPFTETPSTYDSSYFNFSPTPLGSYTTTRLGDAPRTNNIRVSAQNLNGNVIYPGETASTLKMFHDVTEENGYQMGLGYELGKVVPSMGGGICQTTTTLYNAVIRAELTVVSRKSHSMIVSYVEPALDATVDYKSGLDFTFTNTLNYPIYIESYVDGDSVTVNIWGVEEREANRTIAFTSTRTTGFVWQDPLYVQRVDDVNCKVGNVNVAYKQKTLTDPHPGFTAQSYKHVYIDGVEQSVDLLNTSVYGPASGELIHASDCTVQARPNEVPTGSSWATLPNIGIAFTIDTYTLSGEQWPYYPY